jgi:hypothetical protein
MSEMDIEKEVGELPEPIYQVGNINNNQPTKKLKEYINDVDFLKVAKFKPPPRKSNM